MDAEDYLSAAMPEPVRICGQLLLPFSLGHYKRLLHLRNWFVLEPEDRANPDPDLSDLLSGIWVCCQTWEECQAKFYASPESAIEEIDGWAKRIGEIEPEEKAILFATYIRDGSTWPELHPPSSATRWPGAPFIQRVQVTLQSRLHMSRSEALNHPWGEALRDYFCHWEMEDAIKIVSKEDERSVDLVKRAMELVAEGKLTADEAIDQAMAESKEGKHAI